jgi:hypothetical protein
MPDGGFLEIVSEFLRTEFWVVQTFVVVDFVPARVLAKLELRLQKTPRFSGELGGIGVVALGFAAKDMFANLFGGRMIYLDRPFSVGGWIRSRDREIEGTVEPIGWRLTLIRTFDQRPLYLPNAVFTTIAVQNLSRMTNRRSDERISERHGAKCARPTSTILVPDEVRVKPQAQLAEPQAERVQRLRQ